MACRVRVSDSQGLAQDSPWVIYHTYRARQPLLVCVSRVCASGIMVDHGAGLP